MLRQASKIRKFSAVKFCVRVKKLLIAKFSPEPQHSQSGAGSICSCRQFLDFILAPLTETKALSKRMGRKKIKKI